MMNQVRLAAYQKTGKGSSCFQRERNGDEKNAKSLAVASFVHVLNSGASPWDRLLED